VDMPEGYRVREQTYLKHRVLEFYLNSWSQKIASTGKYRQGVRLWYVDCFAGPWKSNDEALEDTSVAIGLEALEMARAFWTNLGAKIEARAIFVEANDESAQRLEAHISARKNPGVLARVLRGEFAEKTAEILGLIAADPAFVFVDPTGWKGAGMRSIAPLLRAQQRDVMVNVMFHHINRFKGDEREFLRQQMRDFFGLGGSDLDPGLDEAALMRLYRERLKIHAGLRYAADLAVPHPTRNQTFFRLVVGGHHPAVIKLFRDAEEKVVGRDAALVREQAKARVQEARTGQLGLGGLGPTMDSRYQRMRDGDKTAERAEMVSRVRARRGSVRFKDLWPELLCEYHISHRALSHVALEEVNAGRLVVRGRGPRDRTIKDGHLLSIP